MLTVVSIGEQIAELLRARAPRKPWCCDEFIQNSPRKLEAALGKRYIQLNPPGLYSFITVDVDRAGAADSWLDADLPPPTWATINPKNGHAHLVWMLSARVWAGGDNQKPARLFEAVEVAYTTALRGDAGFAGLLTKNPLHQGWLLHCPAGLPVYDLQYMAEFVTLPKRTKKKEVAGESIGRNCMVFDMAREWAYAHVAQYEDIINFGACVMEKVEQLNAALAVPMRSNEVLNIARSITRWTWKNMRCGRVSAAFSRKQAGRGKLGGLAKGAANSEKRARALLMSSEGTPQTAIAAELGITTRTIRFWLSSART